MIDGPLHELTLQWLALKAFFAFDTARLYQPEMVLRLALQVMLLFGSAFFAGSETALFSLSRLDLQRMRKERNRYSEILHELLDQPRRLIISILCGNEVINIAAAANMTGILVILYGDDRAGLINVLVMVPLILLFGEVTPKTVAVSNPFAISTSIVARPMSTWVKLIAPLRWLIRSVSDRVTTWIVGEEKAKENILQIDEFRSLVEEVADEGELAATERALIYNLLEAGDTEIVEIMTPRTRTAFINANFSVPEIVGRFRAYRHSRVPVYRDHRDGLIGFLHAEDILKLVLKDVDLNTVRLEDILSPTVVVPLTKTVDEMFDFFQRNRARAAIVLNEFGGVEGFITMQDVLNFIFGHISGEIEGAELYEERDENVYEVPGDMKLTDFNNLTNFGLEDPRMTTVGGVAFRHLDRLPRVGDKVTVDGFVMTVLQMDEHRIAEVRVVRGTALDEDIEEAAESEAEQAAEAKGLESADAEAPPDLGPVGPERVADGQDASVMVSDSASEIVIATAPALPARAPEAPQPSNETDTGDAGSVGGVRPHEAEAAEGAKALPSDDASARRAAERSQRGN